MVAVNELAHNRSEGECVWAIACGEVGFAGCEVSLAGRGGVCLALVVLGVWGGGLWCASMFRDPQS